MTEAQLELLRDKHTLWSRMAREGSMELRDYNRRSAEALGALLAEHSGGFVLVSEPLELLSREALGEQE